MQFKLGAFRISPLSVVFRIQDREIGGGFGSHLEGAGNVAPEFSRLPGIDNGNRGNGFWFRWLAWPALEGGDQAADFLQRSGRAGAFRRGLLKRLPGPLAALPCRSLV